MRLIDAEPLAAKIRETLEAFKAAVEAAEEDSYEVGVSDGLASVLAYIEAAPTVAAAPENPM